MSSFRPTRREFLAATTLAAAGELFRGSRAAAQPIHHISAKTTQSVDAYLDTRVPDDTLRALALHAVDVARQSGASYADVRIAERQTLYPGFTSVGTRAAVTYGVRALVDGVWGFSYGRSPALDAVTQCARDAVSLARLSSQLSGAGTAGPLPGAAGTVVDPAWSPPPVVTGTWQTPIEIDPFTIPVQQHAELAIAVEMMVKRVPGASGSFRIDWFRETRVFAATTGSLLTQRLYRVVPDITAAVRFGSNVIRLQIPELHARSAGYELVARADLMTAMKAAAERAAALTRVPFGTIDVGRYPLVLCGDAMATLMIVVLGQACELDRALGTDVDIGTSYLPLDQLGGAVASPLLTVRGNRSGDGIATVQWDDDGVAPVEHTVVRDGVLNDYHSSVETAPALTDWYRRHKQTPRSNGCAVANDAGDIVMVRPPNLTVVPSQGHTPIETLYKDMRKGILVLTEIGVSSDQQLTSGGIWGQPFEVQRGQLVRRLRRVQMQFNTTPLLKGLTAIGDATTVRPADVWTRKGMPWVDGRTSASAPAALFKEINVVTFPV